MNDTSNWPTDKLTALRLGRRLVFEARKQGWVPSETDRTFRLEFWEYDSELVEGFDYDIGAVLIASAEATGESELVTVLVLQQYFVV
ncbi:hypothetical protein [Streptomyces sp. NPDC090131]|uniref:hypothetical protein n=1 Tax=Streptomyces sp. NPDC090131 TaxID=3365954 RepID=UPI00381400D6